MEENQYASKQCCGNNILCFLIPLANPVSENCAHLRGGGGGNLSMFWEGMYPRCTFQILGGCQGRRTGVGVTTVSKSLILGGWVTKVLKNGDKK